MHHHGGREGCSAPQRLTHARIPRSEEAPPQLPSTSSRRFATGLRAPPLPAAPFAAGPPPLLLLLISGALVLGGSGQGGR